VEYDKENRLAISFTDLSRKIAEVLQIVEIWDSDMGDIEKSDFFQITDPK